MTTTTTMFPLRGVSDSQLHSLCQTLWGWGERCSQCPQQSHCPNQACSWSRFLRLDPFFQYYKNLTASYIPHSVAQWAICPIQSHEDLFGILKYLQENPTTRRLDLTTRYFAEGDPSSIPTIDDQHQAFDLAARVMLMMACSVDDQAGGLLESGTPPSLWRKDQSLLDFIASTFPQRDHPTLNYESPEYPNVKTELKATNLKKVARLKFVGTDDIRHHLELDQASGTVKIYHHTSVLKENLRALERCSEEPGTVPTNALPEQLLVETLDSIQNILFPIGLKSQALLRSLVSKQSFDPDCGRREKEHRRTLDEPTVKYQYWGSRLMDLYDEIENPKARGMFETWLEKNSKARHAMFAALVGVLIAIILGILTLIVAIVQTYIAWQAWKSPVPDG